MKEVVKSSANQRSELRIPETMMQNVICQLSGIGFRLRLPAPVKRMGDELDGLAPDTLLVPVPRLPVPFPAKDVAAVRVPEAEGALLAALPLPVLLLPVLPLPVTLTPLVGATLETPVEDVGWVPDTVVNVDGSPDDKEPDTDDGDAVVIGELVAVLIPAVVVDDDCISGSGEDEEPMPRYAQYQRNCSKSGKGPRVTAPFP